MKYSNPLSYMAYFAAMAQATDWHFLTFSPPNGQQFTGLSGNMVTPNLPGAGTYYIWPGLQPTDNSGVYQNVLDGRSGGWWFGSGWCCSNPSLGWGGGFGAPNGATVSFANTKGASTWTSVTTLVGSSDSASNDFPLNDKNFNQAVFAIELDGPTWTFGPVAFTDIVITATGTDTSFCNAYPSNYNGATNFTISGINPVVGDNVVNCNIAQLTLEGPIGDP